MSDEQDVVQRDCCFQVRGEAGKRQVPGATVALQVTSYKLGREQKFACSTTLVWEEQWWWRSTGKDSLWRRRRPGQSCEQNRDRDAFRDMSFFLDPSPAY